MLLTVSNFVYKRRESRRRDKEGRNGKQRCENTIQLFRSVGLEQSSTTVQSGNKV